VVAAALSRLDTEM
jgi:hypothetical protein